MSEHEENSERATPAEELVITMKDGLPIEVPEQGSLALLALGYKGLMAWRAKRSMAEQPGKATEER